jgi:prolyl-tRNA synthetase
MRGFDVAFQNREGKLENPWYTSWGLSTRSIGGIISSHSDDKGLILPPLLSEYSATILPIYGKENQEKVNTYTRKIAQAVTGSQKEVPMQGEYFRANVGEERKVLIDYRNVRLGEKITDWELSGYPIRIECGERDEESRSCVVVSRITGEKVITPLETLVATIERM